MTTEATDIRFAVDTEEMPLSYPEWRGQVARRLVVEVPGQHLLVSLVLPIETAREWAGELFAGVASAYREATGDAHAMSDEEGRRLPPCRLRPSPWHPRQRRGVLTGTGALRGRLRRPRALAQHREASGCHRHCTAGELPDRPHPCLRRPTDHRDRDGAEPRRERPTTSNARGV
jgi:hypothetical protein